MPSMFSTTMASGTAPSIGTSVISLPGVKETGT